MKFKFEDLEVWKLSMELLDECYEIAKRLPEEELYNLKSQLIRSCTSVALNVAEGSTSQSNAEQARFISIALRSLVETVACHRIIVRRGYLESEMSISKTFNELANELFAKLQSFRRYLSKT